MGVLQVAMFRPHHHSSRLLKVVLFTIVYD